MFLDSHQGLCNKKGMHIYEFALEKFQKKIDREKTFRDKMNLLGVTVEVGVAYTVAIHQ